MFDLNKVDQSVRSSIELYSTHYRIPRNFLYALIKTESNFNPRAFRYEPNYKWFYKIDVVSSALNVTKESAENCQKTSYGLTQLMGAVIHQYYRILSPSEMFNIQTNLIACCVYLMTIFTNKGMNPEKTPFDCYDLFNSGRVDHSDGNEANVKRFKDNYLLF